MISVNLYIDNDESFLRVIDLFSSYQNDNDVNSFLKISKV